MEKLKGMDILSKNLLGMGYRKQTTFHSRYYHKTTIVGINWSLEVVGYTEEIIKRSKIFTAKQLFKSCNAFCKLQIWHDFI